MWARGRGCAGVRVERRQLREPRVPLDVGSVGVGVGVGRLYLGAAGGA